MKQGIVAVAVGIVVVVFGCMTQIVGSSDLHAFLVFVGAVVILCGGLKLTA